MEVGRTIAKLIIGLLEAKSGRIYVDGIELTEETLYQVRSKVGIVFQNPDNQFIGASVKRPHCFWIRK